MWRVDPTSMAVTMHKGDTGAYWVQLTLEGNDEFETGDVAIYEVCKDGTTLIHREYDLQPETPTDICPGDGKFLVSFVNSDTDTWVSGQYDTEIRVVLNPLRTGNAVVDGDTVRTIIQSTIMIQDVYINI